MRASGGSALLAAVFLAPPAFAQPIDKRACVAAHERGQVERQASHLQAAREAFTSCAQAACPPIARKDCTTWLAEVDAALPTVVFEPRAGGKLVRDVRVHVDGALALDHVDDGAELPLDPGPHKLRFDRGEHSSEIEILVVAGEKKRRVPVSVEIEPPPPTVAPPVPVPAEPLPPRADTPAVEPRQRAGTLLAYSFAGVAIVGIGGFMYFGLRGVSDENRLRRECAPACDSSAVRSVSVGYVIADVSLAIGLVAAGVSTVLFLSR